MGLFKTQRKLESVDFTPLTIFLCINFLEQFPSLMLKKISSFCYRVFQEHFTAYGSHPIPYIFLNIYLFLRDTERERQSRREGGAEREGDTEYEAGSRLRAVSTEPDAGLEPTNREIMT